jgi:single-strand DNA-binding protein
MGTLNKVMLIGRLGHDPEERTTAGGRCVSSFSLATDTYRGANAEKTTEWHRVVVFGKIAEQCNRYLHKGRLVCVEGQLQTRAWEKSPGDKKFFTDVVASRVTFLDSRSMSEDQHKAESEEAHKEEAAIPF